MHDDAHIRRDKEFLLSLKTIEKSRLGFCTLKAIVVIICDT